MIAIMLGRFFPVLVLVVWAAAGFLPPQGAYGINPRTEKEDIKVVFGGDVGFGRYVEVRALANGGWDHPLGAVGGFFRDADIACLNFEEPFTYLRRPCNTCMVLGSHPDAIRALTGAGIDVVTLANNHQGDYGEDGLLENIMHLNGAGIAHAGAGSDYAEAHKAAVVEARGVKFGFLSYNEVPPADYAASDNKAGIAWLTPDSLRRDIIANRDMVDVLIVLPHWGIEYTNQPTEFQVKMAHLAIDYGADLVIGNHPHWVQLYETYRGRPIFYALGNLVFDQMWSIETRQGMAVQATFEGDKLKMATLKPYLIYDYSRPEFMKPNDRMYQVVLERAGLESDELTFSSVRPIRPWLERQFNIPIDATYGLRPLRSGMCGGPAASE